MMFETAVSLMCYCSCFHLRSYQWRLPRSHISFGTRSVLVLLVVDIGLGGVPYLPRTIPETKKKPPKTANSDTTQNSEALSSSLNQLMLPVRKNWSQRHRGHPCLWRGSRPADATVLKHIFHEPEDDENPTDLWWTEIFVWTSKKSKKSWKSNMSLWRLNKKVLRSQNQRLVVWILYQRCS